MPHPSITLNLLQPPYRKRIESPEVSFDHVLGDFITNDDELFFGQFAGDFVLHAQIIEDLASSGTPNSMNVL